MIQKRVLMALDTENLELFVRKEVALPEGHVSNQNGYDEQRPNDAQEATQATGVAPPLERTPLSVEAVQERLRPDSEERTVGPVLAAIIRFRKN